MANYEKPDQDTLKRELQPMQFHVTQEEGTEPPFANDYWDNTRPGIYLDVVSGVRPLRLTAQVRLQLRLAQLLRPPGALQHRRAADMAEPYHQDYLLLHPEGYSCHFLRD